jgi:hypothetical protein
MGQCWSSWQKVESEGASTTSCSGSVARVRKRSCKPSGPNTSHVSVASTPPGSSRYAIANDLEGNLAHPHRSRRPAGVVGPLVPCSAFPVDTRGSGCGAATLHPGPLAAPP